MRRSNRADRKVREVARIVGSLRGLPSFFINGHYLSGALDYAALRQIVEQQLAGPDQGTR